MKSEASAVSLAPKGHVPVLDGLRGVALLVVVFYHARGAMSPSGGAEQVYYDLLSIGWSGVDLFFVLSGFLITGILLDSRGSPGALPNFYARRTLRIFPLYYAFLFFALFVWPALGPPEATCLDLERYSPAVYVLYLQNLVFPFYGNAGGVLTPLWSLAVEEQFYLLWPWLVLALPRARLTRLCAWIVLAAFQFRCLVAVLGFSSFFAYQTLFGRMDALAMGALVAILVRSPRSTRSITSLGILACSGGVFSVALLAVSYGGMPSHAPHTYTVGFTAMAVTFAGLLVLVLRFRDHEVVSGVLASRPLVRIGKYSYAMYLTHNIVRELIREGLLGGAAPTLFGSQIAGQLLMFVCMTAGSFAIAWGTWHVFEERMLRLKRFLPTRTDAAHSPGEGALAHASRGNAAARPVHATRGA